MQDTSKYAYERKMLTKGCSRDYNWKLFKKKKKKKGNTLL